VQLGSEATNGKNNIFRFNPGKQHVIFPEHHPYLKNLNKPEKEVIKKKAQEAIKVKTKEDVVLVINEIDKDKNWFERGFHKLEITKKAGANGSTDMDGKIWLKPDRIKKTVSAIDKLQNGKEITFDEADAVSTLWHEITHNRNKPGWVKMTSKQVRYMELANEFVSRNTLSEFYGAFGSKLQHAELVTNRISTGYNRMVKNYQTVIEKVGLKKDDVIDKVKDHLFNGKYDNQRSGLIEALDGAKKSNGTLLGKSEISELVDACDSWNWDDVIKKY